MDRLGLVICSVNAVRFAKPCAGRLPPRPLVKISAAESKTPEPLTDRFLLSPRFNWEVLLSAAFCEVSNCIVFP